MNISFTKDEWFGLCALADTFGFSPQGDCWSAAMRGILEREGQASGFQWWDSAIYICISLDADQSALFAKTLTTASATSTPDLLANLATEPDRAKLRAIQTLLPSFPHGKVTDLIALSELGGITWTITGKPPPEPAVVIVRSNEPRKA